MTKLKRFVIVLCATILLLAVLLWQLKWSSIMDDGPFHGRAVSKMPTSAATQIFPVRDFVLEIYAPETSTEAPVVLLRKPDKSVAWAIHAEGMGNTKVESIEFSEYQTMLDITVLGHVKWTFGNEATTWVIGRDGTLKEYWYSW